MWLMQEELFKSSPGLSYPPIVVIGLFLALAMPYMSSWPPRAARLPSTAALMRTAISASERPPAGQKRRKSARSLFMSDRKRGFLSCCHPNQGTTKRHDKTSHMPGSSIINNITPLDEMTIAR